MKKTLLFSLFAAAATVGFAQEGWVIKKTGKYYGFADKTGREVIPCKYYDAKPFSEGLAAVMNWNDEWGFIDNNGKKVISCTYYGAMPFSEGLAAVKSWNDRWGFIDKTGKKVIPFKYVSAESFSKGVAVVNDNNKSVCINKTGVVVNCNSWKNPAKEVNVKETLAAQFSDFAKKYVEPKINEWQKKGEFEKTADWQQRVNEATRKTKTAELVKEAEQVFIAGQTKNFTLGNITLDKYDPDNEVYLIRSDKYGNWLVPVPINEAQAFKTAWNKLSKTPRYFIENDKIALASVAFSTPNGETYTYSNKASLSYSVAKIDYNFAPIEVNVADNSSSPKGSQNISTVNLSVGKSEVDINIPITNVKNSKTFAVIIANENYRREKRVDFALNDGETFKKYCVQTLGLPEQNVHYVADATLNDIRAEVSWLCKVAESHEDEANIIFYYAGHGVPDEKSKSAYLLPVDGYGSDIASGYKLDDLYRQLGSSFAKTVTVLMDACFSGAQRSGDMMASARGVAIKTQQGKPVGSMVVFSAAQGDETAYPYREKGHGMFTYFLLKKLQETKGNATLGELGSYITTNVKQQSIIVNRKSQTPMVTPSTTLSDRWRGMRLK